jgi:hypothetical protein
MFSFKEEHPLLLVFILSPQQFLLENLMVFELLLSYLYPKVEEPNIVVLVSSFKCQQMPPFALLLEKIISA